MIKGKIAGLTIGGLAGYLLISKGFSFMQNCVAYATDASKWKAYYKYGVNADVGKDRISCVVPPGYSSCTRDIGNGKELAVEDPKQKKQDSDGKEDASVKDLKASLAGALTDAIKEWLKGEKGQEEASEGDSEASEEEKASEDEKPTSGRYPWGDTDGDDILCPEQFDKAPGDPEPLYHDDLEDGVKVTYETVDQIFEDYNKDEKKETDSDETLD